MGVGAIPQAMSLPQSRAMGAVQMTRRLHQLTGRADPALVELGQRLLRTEEQNIQEMKRFL